jgi:Flp pilus assembly pilin Flp
MVRRFLRDEAGASAAEYAMLLILLGCAVILGSIALAASIDEGMGRFADFLDPAVATPDDGNSPDPGDGSGDGTGSGHSDGSAGSASTGGGSSNGCGHGEADSHNPHCKT